jgi:hypothetical protein
MIVQQPLLSPHISADDGRFASLSISPSSSTEQHRTIRRGGEMHQGVTCSPPGAFSQNLAEEELGPFVLRVIEELEGVVLFDNLAKIHEDDPIGDGLGKAHFMADHDHRHALTGKIDHDVENLFDHFRIQGRGRLVKEHYFGLHAEAAGNGHTLLLAA